MIDLVRAASVVERCIRRTAGLNPPSENPFSFQNTLRQLGIDDGDDEVPGLVETLKGHIADSKDIGLPSLVPPFRIKEEFLTFDETSTVSEVVAIVSDNAVQVK